MNNTPPHVLRRARCSGQVVAGRSRGVNRISLSTRKPVLQSPRAKPSLVCNPIAMLGRRGAARRVDPNIRSRRRWAHSGLVLPVRARGSTRRTTPVATPVILSIWKFCALRLYPTPLTHSPTGGRERRREGMGCGVAFQPRRGQNARRTGTPVKEYLPLPLFVCDGVPIYLLTYTWSKRKECSRSVMFDLNHH